jgi:protein-disulfide isomerase
MSNGPERKAPWQSAIDSVASVAIVVTCSMLVWTMWTQRHQSQSPQPGNPRLPKAATELPREPVSLEGAPARGKRNATIAIIEYSDFQCPYCGKFARETLPAIEKKYVDPGKVLLAFRHRPLVRMHPFAMKASEAAECAHRQGKFWEMHDQLFAKQQELDETSLFDRAHDLGLNETEFKTCFSGQATSRVQQDDAGGTAVSIAGTPAFLIGTLQPDGRVKVTQRLTGALPLNRFEAVLDTLITGTQASAR